MERKPVGVEIFDRVAEKYDSVSRFLSFGIIPKLQKKLVEDIGKPKTLLDLGCGTGEVGALLLGKVPLLVGLDYSMPMLMVAKKKYPSLLLVRGDALRTPFPDESFDVVLVSLSLRHFENPKRGLEEIRRILKKGGTAKILEASVPNNPLLGWLFVQFLKRVMLPLGKLRSKEDVTKHLYETIVNFPHREELLDISREVGFKGGSYVSLLFGMATIYTLKG